MSMPLTESEARAVASAIGGEVWKDDRKNTVKNGPKRRPGAGYFVVIETSTKRVVVVAFDGVTEWARLKDFLRDDGMDLNSISF